MEPSGIQFTRVDRPWSEARDYYSRLSKIYDWLASSEKRFVKMGLELLNPRPGEKILEIGFGTGFAQGYIIQAVRAGLSVGLDLASGMAKVCRKNLARSGLENLPALVISNSLPIPFQGDVFDGVFTSFTLELFDTPHLAEVLGECLRVLKPGGRLVAVSLSKDQPLPIMGRLYEGLHNRYSRLLDCRPIPVRQLVQRAGFEISQSIPTSMWGLPVMILDARKKKTLREVNL